MESKQIKINKSESFLANGGHMFQYHYVIFSITRLITRLKINYSRAF
jgi:hypothetical protein